MLGVYSFGSDLVSHPSNCSTILVVRTSPSDFNEDASYSHSKWTTTFLEFTPISSSVSPTGTINCVTNTTDIYGYQATFTNPVLKWFVGPPKNINGWRFTTGTGFSISILYVVNINNVGWYVPFYQYQVFFQGKLDWYVFHIIYL